MGSCLVERANRSNRHTATGVRLVRAGVLHELVKLGPGILRSRMAHINIFPNSLQSPRRAVASQVTQLSVTALVFCADTCIRGDSDSSILRGGGGNG